MRMKSGNKFNIAWSDFPNGHSPPRLHARCIFGFAEKVLRDSTDEKDRSVLGTLLRIDVARRPVSRNRKQALDHRLKARGCSDQDRRETSAVVRHLQKDRCDRDAWLPTERGLRPTGHFGSVSQDNSLPCQPACSRWTLAAPGDVANDGGDGGA